MNPNETSAQPDAPGMDRREFLRLSGTLAAAGALASAGCQAPQEATIPFHDMPENLVDGIGRARFFHTVIDGSPVARQDAGGPPDPRHAEPERRERPRPDGPPSRGAHGSLRSRPGPRARCRCGAATGRPSRRAGPP